MSIIREEKLIYVSLNENSNKFYFIQENDKGEVKATWGRYIVKENELASQQSKIYKSEDYEKKIREKIKKGYTSIPVINSQKKTSIISTKPLQQIALDQIKYKSDNIAEFIEHLCQTNVHNITSNTSLSYDVKTGAFSTAIGLITSDGINDARKWLADINKIILTGQNNVSLGEKVNDYLRIVPQDFGRTKKEPRDIFPDINAVKKQNDILDGLEASLTQVSANENQEKVFDAELELLEDKKEFQRIAEFFLSSSKSMHHSVVGMQIKRIFIVKINPMVTAFDNHGIKLDNKKELWHGSSISNVLSILKSGIKVSPPSTAAIAGKNFGHGAYFAPSSTKSLQYSKGVWSGNTQSKCYLFLNDVALGNYYVPRATTSSPPPAGYDSYWAKSGETGYIQNDEIVVFKESQIKINYLIELE